MKRLLNNNSSTINLHPDYQEVTDSFSSEYRLSIRKMMHEINNALTLINSSLQIIESSHPEVKSFKYWNTTIDDIHYLINLVSEISYFNNSDNLSPEPTDIIALIESIINSFKAYGRADALDISVKALTPIPILQCDKTKLKQVLINLIKNAYEAINQNSNSSYIHITISYNNENMEIIIADNGCGMDAEQLDNIFTPMISYKPNGNGLGLSISKRIIEAHGGTLTVESDKNTGTKFLITLPT